MFLEQVVKGLSPSFSKKEQKNNKKKTLMNVWQGDFLWNYKVPHRDKETLMIKTRLAGI